MTKKRSLRKVPPLNEAELKQAMLTIDSLNISKGGRDALRQIVQAASNPNAEKIDVVIAGMEANRREAVESGAKSVQRVGEKVRTRAAKALMDMSDEEWSSLIESAANGE